LSKKESFLRKKLRREKYPDKPTAFTKVSRPRITKGDAVSRATLGEIIRKMLGRR
jgi:hypothetical protein